MSLSKSQQLFAMDVATLIQFINDHDHSCTFGEAFRTHEQAIINEVKGIGIADSLHCKRLAIDLNLFDKEGKFLPETKSHEAFGAFWESLSPANRWGGKFKKPDGNHYQRNEPNGI